MRAPRCVRAAGVDMQVRPGALILALTSLVSARPPKQILLQYTSVPPYFGWGDVHPPIWTHPLGVFFNP